MMKIWVKRPSTGIDAPKKKSDAPPCRVVQGPQVDGGEVDPLWKTTKWLQHCEEQYTDEDLAWWLLLHPLTYSRDEATLVLAQCLMAAWRWTAAISVSITCLPLQFLILGNFCARSQAAMVGMSSSGWRHTPEHSSMCERLQRAGSGTPWVRGSLPVCHYWCKLFGA